MDTTLLVIWKILC